MTPAEQLAASLARRGTDTAFGMPGGGPNLDVVGALNDAGIRFVLAHGETAACIMAATYGYLTDQVCPAIVTRGPGAASAVNGAAQATLDRQPLLLVTDTVSEASAERIAHQRIDQRALLTPVTKASVPLSGHTSPTEIDDVLAFAVAAPAGAVHLDYDPTATGEGFPPQFTADGGDTTTDAMRLVAAADRPVVIIGLGAVPSAVEVRRAVEDFGAPTLSTYQGVGVLSTEHRASAGLFTNGASEQALLAAADLVVLIGVDPVEPIPAEWTSTAPILAITTTPAVDPYFPITVEVPGDVGQLALSLLVGSHSWAPNAGSDYRDAVRNELAATTPPPTADAATIEPLTPLDVVRITAESVPLETRVTVDAGAHFLAIMPFWPALEPKQLLISNGLATMGYALPAAIGAALARPENPTLCLVGDGGLGMTLAELETVARLNLPITIVVFNDSALSLIEIKQRKDDGGHGGDAAVKYTATDFAAIAAGSGLIGRTVETVADLHRALSAAELTGWQTPRLIDARIDPGSYPHLIKVTRG